MFVRLEDPVVRRPPTAKWALFALGFRPFYLLAALLAATAIPLWVLVFMGKVNLPLPGIWWHAHEMIFGFAAAVIVGFLFTAGRNWTGLPTPIGRPLAALAGLWLTGRFAMLLDDGTWVALLDGAFLPVVAVVLAKLLWRSNQSRHNYFVPVLIGALALANICFHLARSSLIDIEPLRCLYAALMLIVLLETVIAGRVTPGFTASTIKGVRQWRPVWLDIATIVLTGFAFVAWLLRLPVGLVAPLALVAAIAHFVRAFGWNPWAARRAPMLWILHVSYLWIPVGLLLLMAQQMAWVPVSAPMHAFGIGATGGLIIGMITRTALGHTGRTLKVGAGETAAYALVPLAALVRVVTLTFLPALAMVGIHIAATLWAVAFVIYLLRYAPWLARPRLDGQPG